MLSLRKHPAGLYWLSLVYVAYSVAFAVLLANLYLYLSSAQGYGLSEAYSFELNSAFFALFYIAPLFGGYLADRWGFKNTFAIGIVFSLLGMLLLTHSNRFFLFSGLGLFLVGSGLFVAATIAIAGLLYKKEDGLRESGVTLFYLISNIGFMAGPLIAGYSIRAIGYRPSFLYFSICILVSLLIFILKNRRLNLVGLHNHQEQSLQFKRCGPLVLTCLAMSILISFLLAHLLVVNVLVWLAVAFAFTRLIWIAKRCKNKQDRNRVLCFFILCLAGVIYYLAYNTEFSIIISYAEHAIQLQLGTLYLPAGNVVTLDSAYIIILGLAFSGIWAYLEKKKRNPSLPRKFATGLLLAGFGYLLLVSLMVATGLNNKLHVLSLVLVFFFFAMAELLIFPIGISMATRLAPHGKEGFMAGVWGLTNGWASILTGYIALYVANAKQQSLLETNRHFLKLFLCLGLSIFLAGLIVTWLVPRLRRLIS